MTVPHDDIHNRDPYADDELVPFDVQGYSGNRGMWLLGLLFLIALIFIFFLFKMYQPGVRDRGQAPQIAASEAPDKVRNEKVELSENSELDLEIYNAMNGESSDKPVKVTESSEQPADRPGAVEINVTGSDTFETASEPGSESVSEPTPVVKTPTTTAPKIGDSRHVVQLASLRSRSAAEDTWNAFNQKHSSILPRGAYMDIVRADVPNKGTFYRLRLAGLADKSTADRICSRLKSRNQSCFTTTK